MKHIAKRSLALLLCLLLCLGMFPGSALAVDVEAQETEAHCHDPHCTGHCHDENCTGHCEDGECEGQCEDKGCTAPEQVETTTELTLLAANDAAEPNATTKRCPDCRTRMTLQTEEPDCEYDGYTYYECDNCGYYEEVSTIPALGHDYQVSYEEDATCEDWGYIEYECTRCGDYYDVDTDAPLGHNYQASYCCPPDCEEDGYTEYTCTRCGDYYEDDYIPALGHDYQASYCVAPTCEDEGYTEYTCTRCGDWYEDETVPALGHDMQFCYHEDATCEDWGYDVYVCSRCGEEDEGPNNEAPLGHDYAAYHEDATCEDWGYTYYECRRCDDWYEVPNDEAPLGHDYQAYGHTDATCVDWGYTYYECTRCGDWYEEDDEEPTGVHTWIYDYEDVFPAEGYLVEYYYCDVCDATKEEQSPIQGVCVYLEWDNGDDLDLGIVTSSQSNWSRIDDNDNREYILINSPADGTYRIEVSDYTYWGYDDFDYYSHSVHATVKVWQDGVLKGTYELPDMWWGDPWIPGTFDVFEGEVMNIRSTENSRLSISLEWDDTNLEMDYTLFRNGSRLMDSYVDDGGRYSTIGFPQDGNYELRVYNGGEDDYYVDDDCEALAFAASGATVKIYQGNTLLVTYTIPENMVWSDVWKVCSFTVTNGVVASLQQIPDDNIYLVMDYTNFRDEEDCYRDLYLNVYKNGNYQSLEEHAIVTWDDEWHIIGDIRVLPANANGTYELRVFTDENWRLIAPYAPRLRIYQNGELLATYLATDYELPGAIWEVVRLTVSNGTVNNLNALSHNYVGTHHDPDDCDDYGWTHYVCANCSDWYETDDDQPLGHNFVNGVCTRCGEPDPNGNSGVIASGQCGDDVWWTLYENGLLTISGNGYTWGFEDAFHGPWYDYRERITASLIESGVTNIGSCAFYDCYNLTSVTILGDVTSIEEFAFMDCSSLTSVTIPDSVTRLGFDAFMGCSSLTNFTIPDSVTRIEQEAFMDCSSLTNVTIPVSVTQIEQFAFMGCSSLTDVYYGGTEAQWNEIEIKNDNAPLLNATIHFLGEPTEDIVIRLTWGATPSDLDSHLYVYGSASVVQDPWSGSDLVPYEYSGFRYHTAYYDMEHYENGRLIANLDTDDVTSYGPENTTVYAPIADGVYNFVVHDYTNRSNYASRALSNSGATVQVFMGGELIRTYYVPTNTVGCTWDVFTYFSATGQWVAGNLVDHDWDSGEYEPATCTDWGYTVYTCRDCGTTKTVRDDNAPPTGHDYYESNRQEAGIGVNGWIEYTCRNCDDVYYDTIPSEECSFVETARVEPTCTVNGYVIRYCAVHDHTVRRVLLATGHNYQVSGTSPASCTEEGRTTYLCANCGDSYTVIAEPLEHEYVDGVCIHCGQPDPYGGRQIVVASTTGCEGSVITVPITLVNNPGIVSMRLLIQYDRDVLELQGATLGEAFRTAPGSQYVLNTQAYPAIINWLTLNEEVDADGEFATLTFKILSAEAGETVIAAAYEQADVYNGNFEDVVFEIVNSSITLGVHSLYYVAGTAAACTTAGEREHWYCGVCGRIFADQAATVEMTEAELVIEPLGHNPGAGVTENNVNPSCTTAGKYDTVVYCQRCHAELSRVTTTVPALGHYPGTPVEENRVEPGCLTGGGYDTVVYCQRCGIELSRAHTDLPPLGHDYDYYTGVCTRCGAQDPTFPTENSPIFRVLPTSGTVGREVTVTLRLENNPGIASAKLTLIYDANKLEYQGAALTEFSSMQGVNFSAIDGEDGVTLNYILTNSELAGDGDFITVTFKIKREAEAGNTPLTLRYERQNVFNAANENIRFFCVNADLLVKLRIPGDVNGDDLVNNKDARLLFQYVSNVPLTLAFYPDAADVNGDGFINNRDARLLFQYVSGMPVVLV